MSDKPDIELDESPPPTRREMLREALGELAAVVHYGLPDIKDDIDRGHIQRSYDLLRAALKE